jgi:disulfide bond formation protein DsbB
VPSIVVRCWSSEPHAPHEAQRPAHWAVGWPHSRHAKLVLVLATADTLAGVSDIPVPTGRRSPSAGSSPRRLPRVNLASFNLLVALLTVTANVAVVAFTAIAIAARFSDGAAAWRDRMWDRTADVALPVAFAVGLTATLGSLYYSEVAHFPPCELCWYQRIAMYPMPVLLAVAWWRGDRRVRRYVLPVVAIGALIAAYHYQLERFPEQASLSCSVETPCTVVWVWLFHYISIPFMALSGFALIGWLTWIAGQRDQADMRRP